MSDIAFQMADLAQERAEARQALHDMPGLLAFWEAVDFVHVVTYRGFTARNGKLMRALTLPHPLEFVHVVELWHCTYGKLEYVNGYGDSFYSAYRKALEHLRLQEIRLP